MAEKEVETKPKRDEKVVNAEGGRAVVTNNRQTWVIWTVIAGFVVLILLVMAAIFVVHRVAERSTTNTNVPQFISRGGFGGYHGVTYYSQSSSTDGPTTTTTTTKYTVTVGVVTKVNSDSIVVAGNGKTQTIATNSSTTYFNDTKPAVNDTVRIVGTADSNNKVTATEVEVANN
jgi:uncharacterized protein YdeI (BOF family)